MAEHQLHAEIHLFQLPPVLDYRGREAHNVIQHVAKHDGHVCACLFHLLFVPNDGGCKAREVILRDAEHQRHKGDRSDLGRK